MTSLAIAWSLQKAALRSSMQYRLDFAMTSVMAIVYQGSGFAFLWVVLAKFHTIAGWSFGQVAFLYGLRLLAHAVWRLPFSQLESLTFAIREGQFDRYLVRPMNPLVQLMTRGFFMGTTGDIMTAAAVFAYANHLTHISWTPVHIGYLVLAVIGGAAAEGAFVLAATSLGFKSLLTWAAQYLVDQVYLLFGSYPLRLFGATTGWMLTWIVPVAFVAYIPSATLLGRTGGLHVTAAVAWGAPVIGLLWFTASYRFWLLQLRGYQSSGH
jgi:ABC-2 type transport system permease protein